MNHDLNKYTKAELISQLEKQNKKQTSPTIIDLILKFKF
jgi:hypothetical protein